MFMKFLKKSIIICIIAIIIIIVAIMVIHYCYSNDNNKVVGTTMGGENFVGTYGNGTNGKIEYRSYVDIKTYMQKYLNALYPKDSQYGYYENNQFIFTSNENEIKQKIYNLLSNNYINKNNITIENLYDYVKCFDVSVEFVPIEIKLIQDGDIKSFLIYSIAQSTKDYTEVDKVFTVININLVECKYSVEPIYGDYNSIDEINVDKLEDTIVSNKDNRFIETYIKPEDIPVEYMYLYKGLALCAPEKLYELLDEDYRKAKFGNIDEFKKYIEEKRSEIMYTQLSKYKVDVDDENKVRYVLIDTKKNYYIINQNKALTDFSIMLDTYTIDYEEFIDKYDSSENNIKVALNIEKLIDATKDGDYKYVYSKLDDTFKTSNFGTQEKFEKYIKEKFDPENDTITYGIYKEAGGIHIYKIEVKDVSENKKIDAKIVMKLKDDRDFVLSFSAEN